MRNHDAVSLTTDCLLKEVELNFVNFSDCKSARVALRSLKH